MRTVGLYIPSFNAAKTIGYCLDAVFKQTYPIKRIVVLDDGSTDATFKIVSGYSVEVIRNDSNMGIAASRNTAIQNITEEFIASVDADCQPTPEWLAQVMRGFSSPRIACVGGKLIEGYASCVFDDWRLAHMKQYPEGRCAPDFICGSNVVFRRSIFVEVGLYREKFRTNYEDVDICVRLKKRGYHLGYQPKAIIYHMKSDNIYSILNTYWKWNVNYYEQEKYYSNLNNFVQKIKFNTGLANRYIEEDIACGRLQLLYLDFLLFFHHSLMDLEYYFYKHDEQKKLGQNKLSALTQLPSHGMENLNEERAQSDKAAYALTHVFENSTFDQSVASRWIAFLDLVFFYQFNSSRDKLSTFMPKENSSLQNYFALKLIIGGILSKNFQNGGFKRILYKHLFLTVHKIEDACLLDKLLTAVELRSNWDNLFKKKHPALNSDFLEGMHFNLQGWVDRIKLRFPGILNMIEIAAVKTNRLGGSFYDNDE